MRYVINDDCLESWNEKLKMLSVKILDPNLDYVLGEIQSHIDHPLAFNEDQKMKQEIVRLKAMLFHFTGKME